MFLVRKEHLSIVLKFRIRFELNSSAIFQSGYRLIAQIAPIQTTATCFALIIFFKPCMSFIFNKDSLLKSLYTIVRLNFNHWNGSNESKRLAGAC